MKTHSLDQYLGKWVVVYFYPKDDTPGCTTEACNFRDDYFKLRAMDAEVLESVSTVPKAMPSSRKNTACRFRYYPMPQVKPPSNTVASRSGEA